jgi:glucan phosphorylase
MDTIGPFAAWTISPVPPPAPPRGAGPDVLSFKQRILQHVEYTLAELPQDIGGEWETYLALAYAVRDRMIHRWIRTQSSHDQQDAKHVSTTCRSST